jgi:hypothetical protein
MSLGGAIISIISTVFAFVLFVAGIYVTSYAEAAGYLNTPDGINTYIFYYALVWIGFIVLQIIAHLIVLALHPFSPINDFLCDLRDFFINHVLPRLRGHDVTKRIESVLNEVNVSSENRSGNLISRCMIKYVRYIKRHVLQAEYLSIEHPDRFHGIVTTIEQKPGDEDIQRMKVLNNSFGYVSQGKPMNCVEILFTHHDYQFFNDILINGKPPAICIEKAFVFKIDPPMDQGENRVDQDGKQYSGNGEYSGKYSGICKIRHFAPPCGEKIVVSRSIPRGGAFYIWGVTGND